MSKIYCIECLETSEKYIGSTKINKLSQRIACHKYDKYCSCKTIIERGNYKYYLIEEVDESQQLIREQYWIDTTDNCINIRRALGLNRKEYEKEYRELNKNHKKEYDKQYNQLNKDKRKERYKYKCSWGFNNKYNNNLLLIDVSLFN